MTLADISAGKLIFMPGANANGAGYASFTFQVQDNGGTANGGVDTDPVARTMNINVTAINDAPVLSGTEDLSAISENPVSNSGTLVSALISGQVSDADTGALSGIAVTAVDNTNGTWQYSTDGGATWNAFGAPTGATARLLAADANTYVRFVAERELERHGQRRPHVPRLGSDQRRDGKHRRHYQQRWQHRVFCGQRQRQHHRECSGSSDRIERCLQRE